MTTPPPDNIQAALDALERMIGDCNYLHGMVNDIDMVPLTKQLDADVKTIRQALQSAAVMGEDLGVEKKLLEQAVNYFRSPMHGGTTITNIQYLQDLWSDFGDPDNDRMDMKYVQRLLIASEHALNKLKQAGG